MKLGVRASGEKKTRNHFGPKINILFSCILLISGAQIKIICILFKLYASVYVSFKSN